MSQPIIKCGRSGKSPAHVPDGRFANRRLAVRIREVRAVPVEPLVVVEVEEEQLLGVRCRNRQVTNLTRLQGRISSAKPETDFVSPLGNVTFPST